MARRCFYSFHYEPDSWRASTVRKIGAIEGNQPVTPNDWESVAGGDNAEEKIKRWIATQMQGRTCTIVLVGAKTANRKWINHEKSRGVTRRARSAKMHETSMKKLLCQPLPHYLRLP